MQQLTIKLHQNREIELTGPKNGQTLICVRYFVEENIARSLEKFLVT